MKTIQAAFLRGDKAAQHLSPPVEGVKAGLKEIPRQRGASPGRLR
jgi:hypothetical protein